jgi:hypothetical protein
MQKTSLKKYSTKPRFSPLILGVALLVTVLALLGGYYLKQQRIAKISTFEECVKYFATLEIFPAQCNTPDGRSFVQYVPAATMTGTPVVTTTALPTDTAASGSLRTITFPGGQKITVSSSATPKKMTANLYSVYSDRDVSQTLVQLFANKSEYDKQYLISNHDSDGDSAGGGTVLLSNAIVFNDITYKRYVSYYNPIGVTADGKYNEGVSSVMSVTCVSFLGNGQVLTVTRSYISSEMNCEAVQDLDLKIL